MEPEFIAHIPLEFLRTMLKHTKLAIASNATGRERKNSNVSSAGVLAHSLILTLFAMHVMALVFSMGNHVIGANQAYTSVEKLSNADHVMVQAAEP
jgi:hypothetical protein